MFIVGSKGHITQYVPSSQFLVDKIVVGRGISSNDPYFIPRTDGPCTENFCF